MHDQDKAILKSLVAVAWADGKLAGEEKEMLEALVAAFNASDAEADEIRKYAETKRTIDDVPISDLAPDDRRTLLSHAVVLTYIDGHQAEHEKALINTLAERLHLEPTERARIIESAEARAKRLLELL